LITLPIYCNCQRYNNIETAPDPGWNCFGLNATNNNCNNAPIGAGLYLAVCSDVFSTDQNKTYLGQTLTLRSRINNRPENGFGSATFDECRTFNVAWQSVAVNPTSPLLESLEAVYLYSYCFQLNTDFGPDNNCDGPNKNALNAFALFVNTYGNSITDQANFIDALKQIANAQV